MDVTNIEQVKAMTLAQQNDLFRKRETDAHKFLHGSYVKTRGIDALCIERQKAIFDKVRDFDTFNEDNNPYGEHDCGAFTHDEHKIFWKIDYYDKDVKYGSENPADLTITYRVLTVMLASEY